MRPIFSIHKDDVSLILYVIGGLLVARAFMLAAGLPGYLPYIDDILSIIMNYVMSIGDGIRSRVWG